MTGAIPVDICADGDNLFEGCVYIATDHRIFDPSDDFTFFDPISPLAIDRKIPRHSGRTTENLVDDNARIEMFD